MQVFDLEKALRVLKSKKINKERVAKVTGVSTGYLSKMANGKMPVSQNYVDVFLKEYKNEIEDIDLYFVSHHGADESIIGLQNQVDGLKSLVINLIEMKFAAGDVQAASAMVKELMNKEPDEAMDVFDDAIEDIAKRSAGEQ